MDKNHQNPINNTNGYIAISGLFVNRLNDVLSKPTKKKLNPRNDILKQIYSFYDTEQETIHRKRANWKRYIDNLKSNKIKDSIEAQKSFKKSKLFLKKHSDKSIAFFLSHIKTDDLWYILSVAKDLTYRNKSVGAYIIGLQIKK